MYDHNHENMDKSLSKSEKTEVKYRRKEKSMARRFVLYSVVVFIVDLSLRSYAKMHFFNVHINE